MSDHLFEGLAGGDTHRFSLPAINKQRGRDHALPPYNKYRELAGLGLANSFEQLTNIPLEIRERLEGVYKNVNNIDLWSGGVSELSVNGGIIGRTFACKIFNKF